MSKEKDEKIIEEVVEEIAPPVEEEKKPEKKPETTKVDVNAFIARKLKVINDMPNKARAKALADRVLGNKEV